MVKHDLPSMWLEESSALDGGERGTTIEPGATHIFTYFTRYLKAHFQTQLKSKIYVTTVNSYSIQRGQLLIPWQYSSHDTLKPAHPPAYQQHGCTSAYLQPCGFLWCPTSSWSTSKPVRSSIPVLLIDAASPMNNKDTTLCEQTCFATMWLSGVILTGAHLHFQMDEINARTDLFKCLQIVSI